MIGYLLAPSAENDLLDTGAFIEKQNPAAARSFIAKGYGCVARLAEQPSWAPTTRSHGSPVRFRAMRRRYLVVYRDACEPIQIVRGLSTYRDIASLLG